MLAHWHLDWMKGGLAGGLTFAVSVRGGIKSVAAAAGAGEAALGVAARLVAWRVLALIHICTQLHTPRLGQNRVIFLALITFHQHSQHTHTHLSWNQSLTHFISIHTTHTHTSAGTNL